MRKRFGSLPVLAGLSLRIEPGEVYGLLGPNGAGKSTLIHLLLGFLWPDAGRIHVLGARPGAAAGRVGYLPERARYHGHFTAREYLGTLGAISDLSGRALAERRQAVLQLVDLVTAADRPIAHYSKGMLQRLGIAQALIGDPELLLLDEPTSGLDPAAQREMVDLLLELRRRGHTLLVCTHQLSEVERLCDRVGILHGCRLAVQARVSDLAGSSGIRVVVRHSNLPETVASELRSLAPAVQVFGREVIVAGNDTLQRQVLRLLLDAEATIAEVAPLMSGVEELYLRTTRGKPPGEAVAPAGAARIDPPASPSAGD